MYQSQALGILFGYPGTWFRQELPGGVRLTSFDPSDPPHKLEWTPQTVSMSIASTAPASIDGWLAAERAAAAVARLDVFDEERLIIAGAPAARLTLVSGSGGVLHRVLADVSGHFLLIEIEGNYELARAVMDSLQPLAAEASAGTQVQASAVTAPPPVVPYVNATVGYSLGVPGDWRVDETGMNTGPNREVIFSPSGAAGGGVIYLSISLDPRTLEQIMDLYAQSVPDASRQEVIFSGQPGLKYGYSFRDEYYIPYRGRMFMVMTDRPADATVQSILRTVQFLDTKALRDITMADNGGSVDVTVGDTLRLDLDSGYDWAVSVSDVSVLAENDGTYLASLPGQATLTATGNPFCLSSTPPCLMPSLLFTVTVNVH